MGKLEFITSGEVNMNIVIYSDENYEHQVKNFIRSLTYGGIENYRVFYYGIGFNSSIKSDKVVNIYWRKDSRKFEFYKPEICLDVLNYVKENIFYFDADVILSKRFYKMPVEFGKSHPTFPKGPIEFPFTFWRDSKGTTTFDETKLMDYLGVKERLMHYVMACFFTYDEKCRDFLEEYMSFCKNEYLLKQWQSMYAFTDETIANVLLWKRGISDSYGRYFVNTHKFSTFKLCEENEDIKDSFIDGNNYEQCEDSSQVYFYHATKIKEENEKILKYINENS
jgi:hypothetical protein